MLKTRILYFVLLLLNSCLFAQTRNIAVDAGVKYQDIDNFGASDCWSMQKIGTWFPAQKERVAELLFSRDKGIGLSAWRFNIGAGINMTTINNSWRTVETFEINQNVYDWSRQEEERWFLQSAKDHGVDQFIAFVNSPPGRMTRNGYTNCTNGLGSTNLKLNFAEQYAAYLTDILKQFRDEWDISFDYISPVNEPQWEWNSSSNQEGNRAANEDIKIIVDALYRELQQQDVKTKISIIESGDLASWYEYKTNMENEYSKMYGNYLTDLIADPDINSKIGPHFCGHSYWSDHVSDHLIQDRLKLYQKFIPFFNNGMKYWMTEYCVLGTAGPGRDLSINTALDVTRIIHYDLTILRASAWQWWTAVSPEDYKDGLIYTDFKTNPNSQNIIESKMLWALGNFSRFIRPGSVRIDLDGADNKFGLLGSAYINSENDKLIIVLINMGYADEAMLVNVSGLDTGKYVSEFKPYLTSDQSQDDLKEYSSFHVDSTYIIPARSIVTLIGEIADTTKSAPLYNYKLFQNYPNPFNSRTKVEYYLPENGNINISVYSMTGEKIKTLINRNEDEGLNFVWWNGTNDKDQTVSSGIYLCSMHSGSKREIKKMVFIQ